MEPCSADLWELICLLRSAVPAPQVIERLKQFSHIGPTAAVGDIPVEGNGASHPVPLDEAAQRLVLQQLRHDPILAVLGLRPQYLRSMLKRLLVEVEAGGLPVADELADAYAEALMRDEDAISTSGATIPAGTITTASSSSLQWLYKTFTYGPVTAASAVVLRTAAAAAAKPGPQQPQGCSGGNDRGPKAAAAPESSPSTIPVRGGGSAAAARQAPQAAEPCGAAQPLLLLPVPQEATLDHVANLTAALIQLQRGSKEPAELEVEPLPSEAKGKWAESAWRADWCASKGGDVRGALGNGAPADAASTGAGADAAAEGGEVRHSHPAQPGGRRTDNWPPPFQLRVDGGQSAAGCSSSVGEASEQVAAAATSAAPACVTATVVATNAGDSGGGSVSSQQRRCFAEAAPAAVVPSSSRSDGDSSDAGGSLRSSCGWGLVTLRVSDDLLAGSTGCHEWEASFMLAQWVLSNSEKFKGRRVLELGCGAGLVAVALHRVGAAWVAATDGSDAAVANCAFNLRLNGVPCCLVLRPGRPGPPGVQGGVSVIHLAWGDPEGAADLNCEVAVASDVLYDPDVVPMLVALLAQLLRPRPQESGLSASVLQSRQVQGFRQHVREAFIATLRRNPATLELFLRQAEAMSLRVESLDWRQDSGRTAVAFHHVRALRDLGVLHRLVLHRVTYLDDRKRLIG